MLRIQVYALASSFLIFLLIFELVRRRKIKEEYSLLWICAGLALLTVSVFPNLVYHLSRWTQTYYLTTILMLGFSFLFFIVLHFSVVISKLSDRVQSLVQEVAILKLKLQQKEKQ